MAAHLGARVVVSDGDPAEVPQLEANAALLTEACPGAVFAAVVEWGAAAAVDAARALLGKPRGSAAEVYRVGR